METISLTFLVKAFSVYFYCKLIFQQILRSGQSELIFLLVETILFQYLKYPFHWKQFFHLLQMYFKRILHYSQWQWIFCLVGTIFFHSHILETIMAIKGRPIFLKNSSFLLEETIFFNLFRY